MAYLEQDGERFYIRQKPRKRKGKVIEQGFRIPIVIKNKNPSKAAAERFFDEWCNKETRLYAGLDPNGPLTDRIASLTPQFLEFALAHYTKNGTPTTQYSNVCVAIAALVNLHGHFRAIEYTPEHLRTLQQRAWSKLSRETVRHYTGAVRVFFRWCTAEKGLNPDVLMRLRAMAPTRVGRITPRVTGVSWEKDVLPLKPFLSPLLWDMIEIQFLTNARPGEWLMARRRDLDTEGREYDGVRIWYYHVKDHKTEHHGQLRTIPIGPRVQEILRKYLLRAPEAFLFDPREAVRHRAAPKGVRRTWQQPTPRLTLRKLKDHYTNDTYRRAIARACEAANKAARDAGNPVVIKPWGPNRLRHTRTTEISATHGQPTAGATAGHASSRTTDRYDDAHVILASILAAKEG